MGKIIIKLCLFFPVILLITGFSYYIDPGNLFHDGYYEKGIAEILLNGDNVANISDYDDRLLQKHYIENSKEKKDIIILGSSRCMAIRSDLFPEKKFFNNSVLGGHMEDYLAIYGIYYKKGMLPSKVILGLDPWILNRNHDIVAWDSVAEYYNFILKRMNFTSGYVDENRWSKYIKLIKPSYFQSSVDRVIRFKGKYYSTKRKDLPMSKLQDGSLSYGKTADSNPAVVARKAAMIYITRPYSLINYYELDENYRKRLEGFIDLLQHDGVEVVIYLPPYHPYAYSYLIKSPKYKIIQKTQEYIKNLSLKKNIKLLGSYNPADYSLEEGDFYDGMHPKPSAARKIFQYDNLK